MNGNQNITKKIGRPTGVKGNPAFKGALKPALFRAKENALEILSHLSNAEAKNVGFEYLNSIKELINICEERKMY